MREPNVQGKNFDGTNTNTKTKKKKKEEEEEEEEEEEKHESKGEENGESGWEWNEVGRKKTEPRSHYLFLTLLGVESQEVEWRGVAAIIRILPSGVTALPLPQINKPGVCW